MGQNGLFTEVCMWWHRKCSICHTVRLFISTALHVPCLNNPGISLLVEQTLIKSSNTLALYKSCAYLRILTNHIFTVKEDKVLIKPECNDLSQFREDTGGSFMPVREFNLIACPQVQSSWKTPFRPGFEPRPARAIRSPGQQALWPIQWSRPLSHRDRRF